MRTQAQEFFALLAQERLILTATELIEGVLQEQHVNRKELAKRLGSSKAHVSQLLSGERNMTLRTLAKIAHHLGHEVHIEIRPRVAKATDVPFA